MTMNHGTKASTKPRKKPSAKTDDMERKRGVTSTLPPRDSSTRTPGITKKHWEEKTNPKN